MFNKLCRAALFAAAVAATAVPAQARHRTPDADSAKSTKSGKDDKSAGKPVQVAKFGDWGAYLASGKNKTCYVLARPKDRKPEGKKEAAYVFIADRPAEKVHNEVSIMMGTPIKESGAAQATVGRTNFDLIAKGSNAWIKDPNDEAKFVAAIQHSSKLTVKMPPTKGPTITDTYALDGVKQALERVSKDCK